MSTKKELVLRAFRGEEVERVPVGFWYHFVQPEEKTQGLDNPLIFQKTLMAIVILLSGGGQISSRL